MSPPVTLETWRAQVERELQGKPFDRALVTETAEGIRVEPLYTQAPTRASVQGRPRAGNPFKICVEARTSEDLKPERTQGADAFWLPVELADHAPQEVDLILHAERRSEAAVEGPRRHWAWTPTEGPLPDHASLLLSTLAFHDAGAEPADELASALSATAHALRHRTQAGQSVEQAAQGLGYQVALGRDTFLELCKLRALRICHAKLLTAVQGSSSPRPLIHAVCSARTLTQRDPWVNMLRVTTQVFAGALGGADFVTPRAFDEALSAQSPLGRRVALNTGLVLRDESQLGRVADPAGGAYAFEALTDALARQAWERFRTMERAGGLLAMHEQGELAKHLEAAWTTRASAVATRKLPVLGTSEFANLDEALPAPVASAAEPGATGLPKHRDAEPFEVLRRQADSNRKDALLLTLGSASEARARTGFASQLFATAGIPTRVSSTPEPAQVACLCGTDERYATEAVAAVRALKKLGCRHILLAGKPGNLEAALREAGATGFIFLGGDAVKVLSAVVGGQP